MLVGGFTDENATAARKAFETAGEIHFAAEDGVILSFGSRAHPTSGSHACINTAAKKKEREHLFWGEAGGEAGLIFNLAAFVFKSTLLIEIMNSALCRDGGADASDGMPRIGSWRTPESHHTITDEFVQHRIMFVDDRIGDQPKVFVDGIKGFTRLFIDIRFGSGTCKIVLFDVVFHAFLARIGKFREATNVGKQNRDFAPGAAEGKS